ncbi:ribosome biogenesis GTPase Der [Parasphaerochaeta coccoides]|uniref:GTPase Der n=1 Tax=Parasphaerochaeta coccoides (strain ATCC BAA-1237 / DSM 17374 / SPN1) TaxID=760011 RepID=F4GKJ9_PARC1|nr:ribosome biogenesis GTPase Der [Parasphaerochaeta coccoides]AEC02882.1 GTP-binding protein engA [Parasphaerochaeta coccoides DSM 17374]
MTDRQPSVPGVQSVASLDETLPLIAIVGRPNTGKSTLFNRLVGKRRMITDPTPGVTRDPVSEHWMLGGHSVMLVDTGGVKLDREGLDHLVSEKSLSILERAHVLILLLECTTLTPEDEMLVKHLRPYGDKTVLVVNKVDDYNRETLVWNYHSLGYQRVVGISAAHGLGIGDLEDTLMGMLDLDERFDVLPQKDERIKLAVLGKPNTGKSTLTNLLVGQEVSIVSDIPGTTRDVVSGDFLYKGTPFTILDTAGIRRKSKVDEDVEYYSVNRAIKTIDESNVVLLMIDAQEGIADQDKKIAQLIVRRGKGVVLVLNKIDALSGIQNQLEAIKDRVRFLFPVLTFAPLVGVSALKATDVHILLDTVYAVWRQLNKRVDTADVNNALKRWSEAYQPPRSSSGYFKVYYGTQVSVAPVRFLFFVNKKPGFPEIYVQFLKNSIRRDLGFPSIPIEVELRERRRNPAGMASLRSEGEGEMKSSVPADNEKPRKPASASDTRKAQPEGGGRAKAAPKARKPGNKAAKGKADERRAVSRKQSQQKKGRMEQKRAKG